MQSKAIAAVAAVLVAVALGVVALRVLSGNDEPTSALFVGDSYAAGGYRGVSKEQAFPCPTAKELGWTCLRDAVGATGYQSNGKVYGASNDTYERRLPATKAAYPDPDVIVVSGGRNDNQLQIAAASQSYLMALKRAYPRARIFVLEPFWMGPVPVDVAQGRLGVQASARAAGVTWVPTGTWLSPTDLSADLVHPTLNGQKAITQHLAAVLQAAGA